MATNTSGSRRRKTFILPLLLCTFAVRLSAGQNPGGNNLPCGDDNLSCPNDEPLITRCYTSDNLCNGVDFCSSGSDEGSDMVALDCQGVFSGTGTPSYICSNGMMLSPSVLCDGNADCIAGDDEVTSVCENKCRLPHYGGCPYSRQCISTTFSRTCGDCLPGFVDASLPVDTQTPCSIEIGLEETVYAGSEAGQATGEICAVLFVEETAFAGGINGVFDTLQFDHGSQTISLSISSSLASGSNAAQADDFEITSFNLILSRTNTRSCITFGVTDDSEFDPDEVFSVGITSLSSFAVVRPANAAAVVTINDNDPGQSVGFEQILYSFNEESPGQLEVCVELVNSAGPFPSFTVLISTVDATATSPMDFTAFSNRVLSFQANAPIGTTPCTNVVIVNDNDIEDTETFFLDISSSQANIVPGRARATVEITAIRVGFVLPSITVDEEMMPGAVDLCIEITSPGPIPRDAVVNFNTADVTATAPMDYQAISSRSVQFPAGSNSGDTQCVTVTIINDNVLEMTGETFVGILTSATEVVIDRVTTTVVFVESNDQVPFVGIVTPNPPPIPEDVGPAMVCVEISNGVTLAPGRTVTVNIATSSGTAMSPGDYLPVDMSMIFNSANSAGMLCFNITINDDLLCEDIEFFFVGLTSPDATVIVPSATIRIADNDRAEVALVNLEPDMFVDGVYHVTECSYEVLSFDISITNSVQKGPGISCIIAVTTEDDTAEAGSDYEALSATCILDSSNSECDFQIGIIDDFTAEMTESFYIRLSSNDPARCNIANDHIIVNITDDEDCDDNVCNDYEFCEELMCPNNFTCVYSDHYGVGDDPHFAVTLSSGKTLCYTVQGEHGFAFNLISNKKVYMNAMFVPDKDREEVTWLGTMGIVVANSNGFKKSNMTRLRFEAIKNKIHIDDQMVLEARNIEKITIKNGKLTISEAPPTEGYKQPFVRVDLVDVQLSFSIKFMTEHLDLYWHSTGQKVADSHGLIGQFFDEKIVVDEVRGFLIIPGKEPVPIETRPVWSFMERVEKNNSSSLCWVSLNPGYQGEGLIDGSYLDYLVDDVLSTEFMFRKL